MWKALRNYIGLLNQFRCSVMNIREYERTDYGGNNRATRAVSGLKKVLVILSQVRMVSLSVAVCI